MGKIYFCKLRDQYGFLSNFYSVEFCDDKYLYKSSEHYYQSHKFETGSPDFLEIIDAKSAMAAAILGRKQNKTIKSNWERIKVSVMKDALLLKFGKHPILSQKLIATGDSEIIEYSTKDFFWGNGGDNSGMNMLGRLLMEVRTILQIGW